MGDILPPVSDLERHILQHPHSYNQLTYFNVEALLLSLTEIWVLSNLFQFPWTDTFSFKASIIDLMSQRQLMAEADIIN